MDRDGMIDMIYFDESKSSLLTFYNKHQANAVTENNLCKAPMSSAKAYIGESNRFFTRIADVKQGVEAPDVDQQGLNVGKLVSSSSSLPGRVRIGDIDADGFPDLIMTVQTQSGAATQSIIFLNKNSPQQSLQNQLKGLQTN